MFKQAKKAIKSIITLGELFSHDALDPVAVLLRENEELRTALGILERANKRAEAGAQEAHRNKQNCHEKHERARAQLRAMEGAAQRAKQEAASDNRTKKREEASEDNANPKSNIWLLAKEAKKNGQALIIYWEDGKEGKDPLFGFRDKPKA